jgi:polyribonucleotide nucleotidyltransferase
MATVCAGTLSLMDAGIPMIRPISELLGLILMVIVTLAII